VFRLAAPSQHDLDRHLGEARQGELTYPFVGATRTGEAPPGYRLDHYECHVGFPVDFDRAKAGLMTWQGHRHAGAHVHPDVLEAGETVIVVFGVGPIHVLAPCRIVYVVDEPDRFGFAYGTLPGHPEEGEEAFLVERGGDRAVKFTIHAFSRPAQALVRASGPIGRSVQRRTTSRYLEGLAGYAAGSP